FYPWPRIDGRGFERDSVLLALRALTNEVMTHQAHDAHPAARPRAHTLTGLERIEIVRFDVRNHPLQTPPQEFGERAGLADRVQADEPEARRQLEAFRINALGDQALQVPVVHEPVHTSDSDVVGRCAVSVIAGGAANRIKDRRKSHSHLKSANGLPF